MIVRVMSHFFKQESASGILLVCAAVTAMCVINSPVQGVYKAFLHYPLASMSVAHWINDGLMAIFFLQIGLEVKRELMVGALNSKESAIFPAVAALGGVIFPALIYVAFNYHDSVAIQGWAIPTATDIAFALGVMALLGSRIPVSLKVFLLALAIIDDLAAVVIIAFFYTSDLSIWALGVGLVMTALLFTLNAKRVTALTPYLVVGAILWSAVLQSGVHATLAGVVVGFAIPLQGKEGKASPLESLEHKLQPYVAFGILPLFAFANAGISLQGVSLDALTSMLPLGIALGLLIGKPLGIFSFSLVSVKMGITTLPENVKMRHIFAVSVLCGIGFTMSIFIASLAFGAADANYDTYSRLGILIGSTIAAFSGYSLLRWTLPKISK